ncbi:histidine phosphatase family protein [Angustibacter luteus]|uniref:Histidine phosphatase family protein n=1 Tax=Angustibacter luteus TaxID=658456 RepID=A0ABW1J9J5_9ACTN
MAGHLVLVRHGQTEWAAAGRHTGRTDVRLTAAGEDQARHLRDWAGSLGDVPVLSSPLQRARRTAELAGFTDVHLDDDLVEWDYGGYEGLTTDQIRERTGQPWHVFADGVVPGDTPGETLAEVATRTHRVLDRIRPMITDSDVVLVAHGHVLRVLAASWLGAEPALGAHLELDPAGVAILGTLHEVPAIHSWNLRSPDLASGGGVDSAARVGAPMVDPTPTTPDRRGDDL